MLPSVLEKLVPIALPGYFSDLPAMLATNMQVKAFKSSLSITELFNLINTQLLNEDWFNITIYRLMTPSLAAIQTASQEGLMLYYFKNNQTLTITILQSKEAEFYKAQHIIKNERFGTILSGIMELNPIITMAQISPPIPAYSGWQQVQLPDLFRYSYPFSAGYMLKGMLAYEIKANSKEVKDFYEKELEKANWQTIQVANPYFGNGDYIFQFEKQKNFFSVKQQGQLKIYLNIFSIDSAIDYGINISPTFNTLLEITIFEKHVK